MQQRKIPQPQITLEMLKTSQTFQCDCEGILFEEAMFFKRISPIISPTGNEELAPIPVIVCKKCGKIPSKLVKESLVPEILIAKSNSE